MDFLHINASGGQVLAITKIYSPSEAEMKKKCNWCGKKFSRKSNGSNPKFVFCSRTCKEKAQSLIGGKRFSSMRPKHYKDGRCVYRDRAIKYYGAICNRCKYDKSVVALQVHHKDNNRKNNSIKNLEVLCANCHSIETWG